MKLWYLENLKAKEAKIVYYDTNYGIVVRASCPINARKIAARHAEDEGHDLWLDIALSSCKQLKYEGKPGVVIVDFNAG